MTNAIDKRWALVNARYEEVEAQIMALAIPPGCYTVKITDTTPDAVIMEVMEGPQIGKTVKLKTAKRRPDFICEA